MSSNKIIEMLAEKVMSAIEKGERLPWVRPWKSVGGMPRNAISNREYSGINFLTCCCSGFDNPFFMTFKQASENKLTVKKGSKATPIIFWKRMKIEAEEDEEEKSIPFMRYFSVFNINQMEGDIPKRWTGETEKREVNSIIAAQAIIDGMPNPPEIKIGEGKPCYHPTEDAVYIPKQETFISDEEFYGTMFHELVHSTGADKRVGRKFGKRFGDSEYAFEELIAETGAAILCARCGIDNTKLVDNSAGYLQSWMMRLRKEPKIFFDAVKFGGKGADYIVDQKHEVHEAAASN